jgi:hypothetical protein
MSDQESEKSRDRINEDELVRSLIPDPAALPDARVRVGFLGRSARARHWRLYLTPELNDYLEFTEPDVLHVRPLEGRDHPLGGSAVWFRREANLVHTRAVSREAQADFLQGDIAARHMATLRWRMTAPILQGKIFLSFEGHANSCVSDICENFMAPSWMSGGDVICTFNCR